MACSHFLPAESLALRAVRMLTGQAQVSAAAGSGGGEQLYHTLAETPRFAVRDLYPGGRGKNAASLTSGQKLAAEMDRSTPAKAARAASAAAAASAADLGGSL